MTNYSKNDPESIQSLFNSIAKQYDKTNGILSLQLHKRWNRSLIDQALAAHHPKTLLDLCCGTGAIALNYLTQAQHPVKAYLLDFSESMLAYAQDQAQALNLDKHEINYLHADAQQIPLPNDSVDCTTIAYGIRNIKKPESCIEDVFRVLKPNGTFAILELTKPKNPLLKLGHTLYLKTFVPLLGKFLTSNQDAYRYLCNSIQSFIPAEELEKMMQQSGFQAISTKPLCGGVATLLIGKKARFDLT
jgi:demethylmenaquinone methyltransferase / 2-methoxy-6-polyprenyl-1,4-benzoquinol methylase